MASIPASLLALALLGSGQTVLLDFHADWCGPCRQLEPTISQLADRGYPVHKVNVDQHRALASQYGVESIPCLVLLVDGREVDRRVGGASLAELESMFAQAGVAPAGRGAPQQFRGQSPDPKPVGPLVPVEFPAVEAAAPFTPGSTARHAAAPPRTTATAPSPRASRPSSADDMHERLLAAAVRLKVHDPDGHSWGSGTVIDARAGEALVLTCGHIFRDSQGRGRIEVDLFAPGSPRGLTGELIGYDDKADVGLVSIRTDFNLTPIPVAPSDYAIAPGDAVFTIGCSNAADPTVEESRINSIGKFLGPPNLQVAGQPVDGRSGGGLVSADGYVIGVCNAADPSDNEGLFAALDSIHAALDTSNLSFVYQELPSDTRASGVAAAEPPDMPSRMPDVELPSIRGSQTGAAQPTSLQGTPRDDILVSHPALSEVGPDKVDAGRGLSDAERAALSAIEAKAGGAEVICVIRPLADPRAKSEIIVLDNASSAFLEQLASEQVRQDSRRLTSLNQSGGTRTKQVMPSRPATSASVDNGPPQWQARATRH